ncbi:addiction module HigA family antidote [Paraburkholderia tropica]|uniref:HigA family addiction module antitoxin n=1 Tax=Paraburkholderia tropica TaxID=92647 RepID=UPI00160CFCC2|nr:HigA family addiction module antitoxin [Paraburkholderia tropica]MBB2999789.1 addiction module HigA family antidote [Paraburkholderia tropica]
MSKHTRSATHPGAILRLDVLPALKLKPQEAAVQLDVPVDDLVRVLNAAAPVTAELAARIEAWLGRDTGGDAQHWLAMQAQYDLWQAQQPRRRRLNTPEREAEIQRGIAQDPDVPEMTREQIQAMKARRRFETPTSEEAAEIERHAIEDDNPIATEEDVARAVPLSEVPGKGRTK